MNYRNAYQVIAFPFLKSCLDIVIDIAAFFVWTEMLFLKSDTLVLPLRNATVEEFSRYLLDKLIAMSAPGELSEAELFVASGPGQKAGARWCSD